jgi:hypothetical protein
MTVRPQKITFAEMRAAGCRKSACLRPIGCSTIAAWLRAKDYLGEGRMRTFIFALAAIVPAFAIDCARAADKLPALDIARNCKAETAGSAIGGPESCARDETQAKNDLAKRWSSFSASQKKECVGESRVGGEESYVELLTCLEMSAGGHFSTGEEPNR